MNCQTFSTGFNSGHFGGSGMSVIVAGTTRRLDKMPSGLIEQEHGVFAGSDLGRDLGQVQVHRLGIAARQDERCALPVARADGAEDIGRGGTLIGGRRRPCPTPCPTPRDLVLLADPGLVGEPEFYVVGIDALVARDRRHAGRETFLKASIAPSTWA